jgi:hypothetical protein
MTFTTSRSSVPADGYSQPMAARETTVTAERLGPAIDAFAGVDATTTTAPP